jgi:hypothetical protein
MKARLTFLAVWVALIAFYGQGFLRFSPRYSFLGGGSWSDGH